MDKNNFFNQLSKLYFFDTKPSDKKIDAFFYHLSLVKKRNGSIEKNDLDEAVSQFFSQELSRVCYCLDTSCTINIIFQILSELNKHL